MAFLDCLEIVFLAFKGQYSTKLEKQSSRSVSGVRQACLGMALLCPLSGDNIPSLLHPPGHGHHIPSAKRKGAQWHAPHLSEQAQPPLGTHAWVTSSGPFLGSIHNTDRRREGECEKIYFLHFLIYKTGGQGRQGAPKQNPQRAFCFGLLSATIYNMV